MQKLLEAFQIFATYSDDEWPICCEHDILHVCVNPDEVSPEDIKRLKELGFHIDPDFDTMFSMYC